MSNSTQIASKLIEVAHNVINKEFMLLDISNTNGSIPIEDKAFIVVDNIMNHPNVLRLDEIGKQLAGDKYKEVFCKIANTQAPFAERDFLLIDKNEHTPLNLTSMLNHLDKLLKSKKRDTLSNFNIVEQLTKMFNDGDAIILKDNIVLESLKELQQSVGSTSNRKDFDGFKIKILNPYPVNGEFLRNDIVNVCVTNMGFTLKDIVRLDELGFIKENTEDYENGNVFTIDVEQYISKDLTKFGVSPNFNTRKKRDNIQVKDYRLNIRGLYTHLMYKYNGRPFTTNGIFMLHRSFNGDLLNNELDQKECETLQKEYFKLKKWLIDMTYHVERILRDTMSDVHIAVLDMDKFVVRNYNNGGYKPSSNRRAGEVSIKCSEELHNKIMGIYKQL